MRTDSGSSWSWDITWDIFWGGTFAWDIFAMSHQNIPLE
ncbi:hypothetical protein P10159_4824 [Citrobacter portucalensis]|nr:hypothetical protein P10159_4824 [Citrobacter portucalensis]